MKVGIDVSASVYGTGVSDYVVNLINHLSPESLVLWGASWRRAGELRALFNKVTVFPFPPTGLNYLWNKAHIIPVEWLVGKVDIWHSSDWAQPPSKAKKVTTVHDLSPFLYPTEMDSQLVSVHQARMKWVVAECDQIICVSQNTGADLKRLFGVAADRIKIIYEALPSRFQLKPQIAKQSNYIVTIGARQLRKNTQALVSAFVNFKDKYSLPPKLIVIGENSQQAAPPNITYTGYVSDQQLVDLLAGAAAFVYPSLYEGFGLPILGAFYHQVPVACSNTSSLPEVAGDAAIYFDPLNDEAIAKAVAEAVSKRSKLIEQGRKQLAKFSWDKAASQTMAVYQSLL